MAVGGGPVGDLGIPGLEDPVEIGRGGFGAIYRASQVDFDRVVAVKVLFGVAIDELSRERFERERRAMGAVSNHPHIVTVYDSGYTSGGHPYITMEYMTGGSFSPDERAPLAWDEAVEVAVKLCGGLETAHRAGVLHRDLKPENILLSAYGEPHLGDFGIARVKGGLETRSGVISATVAHAPPEVLDGRRPSPASDIYSLTSTLFTLIRGCSAFERDTDEGVAPLIFRITTEAVPDLRDVGVPGPVCDVIGTGMAKDLANRYASASELGHALQEAQRTTHRPVTSLVVLETAPQRGDVTDSSETEPPDTRPRGREASEHDSGGDPQPTEPPPQPGDDDRGEVGPTPTGDEQAKGAEETRRLTDAADHPRVDPWVKKAELRQTGQGPSRRPLVLAGAAALLVVALVGGLLAFGGDPGDGVAAGGGSPGTSSSTTELDPDAEPLDLVRTFDPEGDAALVAQRTFRFSDDGSGFRNDTVLRNATADPVTRIWFEVVPKQLATAVADVSWSIQPTGVVVDDPVVYFEVQLGAGAELTLTWSTPLPDGAEPSIDLLDELVEAHAVAVAEAADPIAFAAAGMAAQGAEVVDPQVPEGGTTQTTVSGGSTDGSGSGDGGGSGGTTNPTTSPTVAPTTPTTQAPITAPSAPRNAVAQNPVAVSINPQTGQGTMRITVSWSPPTSSGGQTPTYRVTWTQVGNGCPSNDNVVNSGSSTTGSTSATFDMVNATTNGCSYVRYQVVASNSGGSSGPTTASGTVPNILGKQHAYHLVRAASGRAVNGGADLDCGQPAYSGCQTSPSSGTITAGSIVGVRLQQE
jgi:serine/threonine-protein kinase PknK